MKKGNIGVTMAMVGKKLKASFGAVADLGLTGKDGVVHPSLEVNTDTSADCCFQHILNCFCCFQDSAKKLEENVNFFGSTVEGLLYRYGKVLFD